LKLIKRPESIPLSGQCFRGHTRELPASSRELGCDLIGNIDKDLDAARGRSE